MRVPYIESKIQLTSGAEIDLQDPDFTHVPIEDIAHGLSNNCRFVGQCAKFYSVAEHSVLVSLSVPDHALFGLLHDGAEAIIGDVSSPLKRLLHDYKVIERRLEVALWRRFGLGDTLPPEVKSADYRVLAAEIQSLMPQNHDWVKKQNIEPAPVPILALDPVKAKQLFLARYRELVGAP